MAMQDVSEQRAGLPEAGARPVVPPAEQIEQIEQIPADIKEALSPGQIARLVELMVPRTAEHVIALRASTVVLGQGIYLALFMGPERRSPGRLVREDQRRSVGYVALHIGLAILALIGLLLACSVVLYIIKSVLGIDVVAGPSFMHHLIYDR